MRLKRDVLPYKPTVVTICLGMNDGSYRAFDENIFNTYAKGFEHILDTLKQELPGVRITLLTAPAFDDVTRAPNFPGGYNATLLKYGEFVKGLGKKYNLTVADTNAPLVEALEKAKQSQPELAAKIIPDRVHPMHGGHLIMAAAVLKAWNAPDTVADIEINAAAKKVVKKQNVSLSGVKIAPDKIAFTQTLAALPWAFERDENALTAFAVRPVLTVTDIEPTLNRYVLKVTGLHSGQYALKVDGQDVANLSSDALAQGVDLAELPMLPENKQANEVLALTRKHNDLHFKRWRQIQVPNAKNGLEVSSDIQKQMDDLDAQEVEVLKQLQAARKPQPHAVELAAAP